MKPTPSNEVHCSKLAYTLYLCTCLDTEQTNRALTTFPQCNIVQKFPENLCQIHIYLINDTVVLRTPGMFYYMSFKAISTMIVRVYF